MKKEKRCVRVHMVLTKEGKRLLDNLAILKERSRSGTMEFLIMQEARKEGLIEPLNTLLDK